MTEKQIHRVVTDDGTEIVGSVQGDGPPLVFVHGAMDDGTLQWGPVVPYLANRFNCHVISMRNRGRSGHSEDLSPPRLIGDIAAYSSSIGKPVGLVGLSAGGNWILGAAIQLMDISGVVAYEPVVFEVISEEILNRLSSVIMHMGEEAEKGQLTFAVRIFAEFVGNDDEIAAFEAAGSFEKMGLNVPADLAVIQQSNEYQGPNATDPAMLAKIAAPVMLLQGGRSNVHSWFHAGVNYVAEHVTQATVHEFTELGHLAPMVAPEPVAEKIASFFDKVHQR